MKPRSFAILGLLTLLSLLIGYLRWASFSTEGGIAAATQQAYEPTKIEAQKQLTILNDQRQQEENLNIQNHEMIIYRLLLGGQHGDCPIAGNLG